MAFAVHSVAELEKRLQVFNGEVKCISSKGTAKVVTTFTEGRYFFIKEKDEPIVCSRELTKSDGTKANLEDVERARERFRRWHKCFNAQHLTFKRKLPDGRECTICGICGKIL